MNKKAAASKNRQAKIFFTNVRLRPSDWVLIPLVILIGCAIWSFIVMPIDLRLSFTDIWYRNILYHPSVIMLAIAIFSALYIYQDIRREDVGVHARRIAFILSAIVVILVVISAAAMISSETTPTCTGLFHSKITCAEEAQFKAIILLMNPFSALFWGFLSVVGTITLLPKMKRHTSK